MKETKFRAIHKLTKKKWANEELVFHNGVWYEDWRAFEDGTPLNMSQCAVMEYTGLKDKKGVEIYEGDIVRFTNSIDEIYNEVGKVTWEQSECNFVAQYKTVNCVTQEENGTTITIYLISNETYRECVEYEVIGNIYENPELLDIEERETE